MRIYGPVIVLALAAHSGLSAQQVTREPTSTEPKDIVVVGRDPDGLDADAPDLANRKRGVVLGSRIPRYSLQNNPMIAMKTSPNGLTPGSGIDPYKEQRTVFWKSCRADGAVLRKQVACRLVDVQKLISTGKLAPARLALENVARLPSLSVDEQFATLQYQYRIAEATNDPALRRTALAGIVDIDVLPNDEQESAVRSLAADAWNRGDREEALRRFEQASRLDPSDAVSRANAAAALQATGRREPLICETPSPSTASKASQSRNPGSTTPDNPNVPFSLTRTVAVEPKSGPHRPLGGPLLVVAPRAAARAAAAS